MGDLFIDTASLSRASWRFRPLRNIAWDYYRWLFVAVGVGVGLAFAVDFFLRLGVKDENQPRNSWGQFNFGEVMGLFVSTVITTWCTIDIFYKQLKIDRLLQIIANLQSLIMAVRAHVVMREPGTGKPTMRELVYTVNGRQVSLLTSRAVFELYGMLQTTAVLLLWQLQRPTAKDTSIAIGTVRNIEAQGGTAAPPHFFAIEAQASRDTIMATVMLQTIISRLRDMQYAARDTAVNQHAPMVHQPEPLIGLSMQTQQKIRELFVVDGDSHWERTTHAVYVLTLVFLLSVPFFYFYLQGLYMVITMGLLTLVVGGAAGFSYYTGHVYHDATDVLTGRVYAALENTSGLAHAQYFSLFGDPVFMDRAGNVAKVTTVYLPRGYVVDKDA